MQKLRLTLLLTLLLALAACGSADPTPTPLPTEASPTAVPPTDIPPTEIPPTAEPTAEPLPESPLDAIDHQPDPNLIDTTWLWVSLTTPVEEISVDDPTRYTITFNADGTANAVADCNVLVLEYASNAGAIRLLPGLTSAAACPEDSLDQQFVQALSNAALYFFQDGDLLIDQQFDSGTLRFVAATAIDLAAPDAGAPTATVDTPLGIFLRSGPGLEFPYVGTAAEGASGTIIGQDDTGQWWAIAAPSLPDGRVWVAAEFVTAVNTDDVPIIWPEPELTGTTWQWVGLTTPLEATAVTDPTRYTITFNNDGTALIRADCNNVIATYETDGAALALLPGPSTLVACPPDSLGDQFVAYLNNVVIHFFQNGDLFMDMKLDSGTLRLTPLANVDLPEPTDGAATATVTAPDGIFLRSGPGTAYPTLGTAPTGDSGEIIGRSEDGEWWVIAAPNLPDGQVWVAAAFVEALNADDVPVIAAPPLQPSLTGVTWEWVFLTTGESANAIAEPERYTITFNTDNTAAIRADCNNVIASYTAEEGGLSIVPGPTTLVACPDDSLGDQFVSNLSNVVLYFFQDGDLFMDMFADAGTLRFAVQTAVANDTNGTAVTTDAEDPLPVSSATGLEFQVLSFGPVGAEEPLLEGSAITALFSAAEVSGSAGCNTYTGPLNPISDYFTVGPIATTLMLCDEPLMQQEQAYLTALESLTGYQWGSELVDGARVVTTGQLFYSLEDGTNGVINLFVP